MVTKKAKKSPAPKSPPKPKSKRKPIPLADRALKAAARLAKKEAKAARLAKSLTPEGIKAAAKAQDARRKIIFNTCSQEYEAVLAYQNGVCYITGRPPGTNSLAIDHRHADGLLRGLLSPQANRGIALFQDNPDWLRKAADYLDNPPYTIVVGEPVYGMMGRISKKAKSRKYGPLGTKTPQPRKHKLYTTKTIESKEGK